jgi:hypothetical protein
MSSPAEAVALFVYAAGLTVMLFGLVMVLALSGEFVLDKAHLFSALVRNLREYTLYRREFWAWRKRQENDE